MQAIRQFIVIARLTALEAIRQPICLLLLTTCVVVIALFPFIITHTLEDTEKLVRDSALATHLLVGLVLGSYTACAALVREIDRGTGSSLLSKPVNREIFFLAKYSGVALVMLAFSICAGIATVISTRIGRYYDSTYLFDWRAALPLLAAVLLAYAMGGHANFHRRRPFNSVTFVALELCLLLALAWNALVSPAGTFGSAPSANLPLEVLPASLLVTLAIFVLAAIAVSLAPRFETVPTLCICSVVLMLGLLSDYFFGEAALAGHPAAVVAYYLIPNWQHFWVVDALTGDNAIAFSYVGTVALYALVYGGGMLILGALLFRRMELR